MGGFSIWHILIFAIIVLLLFGGNRFSAMMGDVAKGIKSLKKGLADETEYEGEPESESTVFRNNKPALKSVRRSSFRSLARACRVVGACACLASDGRSFLSSLSWPRSLSRQGTYRA